MIEYMLADVICCEFEKAVGKGQHETGLAMHVGFGMRCLDDDQYDVTHMYVHAPMNYVYVAIQRERIDAGGARHVEPMEIISYHDSCWRDSIQQWLFKNSRGLNVFSSFKMFEWHDVIHLSEKERRYLDDAERWRRDNWSKKEPCPLPNPFDKRGIWAGKSREATGA